MNKPWDALNDIQKRVKLAEVCGDDVSCIKWQDRPNLWFFPDYLNDLNAIQKEHAKLSYTQQVAFIEHLGSVVSHSDNRNDWVWGDIATARSDERAKALFLTLVTEEST